MPKIMRNGIEYGTGGGGGSSWIESIPEMHRNIFRGNNLGSEVTAAQLSAIQNGTFSNLYVGDYWRIPITIDNVELDVNWRIADMDYFLGTGSTNLAVHHLVLVPDICLSHAIMGSANYWQSSLRSNYIIGKIKPALDEIFPNLLISVSLQPTVSDPTYIQSYVEIMSAYMVVGFTGLYVDGDRSPIDKTQLSLFRLSPKFITIPDDSYWLSTLTTVTNRIQAITNIGELWRGNVSSSNYGIRPYFLIGVNNEE